MSTVDQARELKTALEIDIQTLLQQFTRATGLTPKTIDLTLLETSHMGERHSRFMVADVTVGCAL
jgi:hypothetical protein